MRSTAQKNKLKACSFSWGGSVCRIRAYLDMAQMGFLNKGPGEGAAQCSTRHFPDLRAFPDLLSYLPVWVKLSRPWRPGLTISILGGCAKRGRRCGSLLPCRTQGGLGAACLLLAGSCCSPRSCLWSAWCWAWCCTFCGHPAQPLGQGLLACQCILLVTGGSLFSINQHKINWT